MIAGSFWMSPPAHTNKMLLSLSLCFLLAMGEATELTPEGGCGEGDPVCELEKMFMGLSCTEFGEKQGQLPRGTEVSTERGGDENGSSVLGQWGEGEGNPAIPKCSVEVRVAHLQSNWKGVVRGWRLT
jgi:hypothetical protein